MLSSHGSLQKESKKSSSCKKNYPSKCNVLFRATSLHHLQPPLLHKKIWIYPHKLKCTFIKVRARLLFWHLVHFPCLCRWAPLSQAECICMHHWDALINIAALAEGGVWERHGRTECQLQSQKGTFSDRDEDEALVAQVLSTCEESLTWTSLKYKNWINFCLETVD